MADRFGYGEVGLDIHPCKGCEDYEPSDGCKTRGGCAKSMTNADCIRSLSDEELAERFADGCCRSIDCPDAFHMEDGLNCYGCWLDWLKSPAKEDE